MSVVDWEVKRYLRGDCRFGILPSYSRCALLLRSYRFVRWVWLSGWREAVLRWKLVWRDACNCGDGGTVL